MRRTSILGACFLSLLLVATGGESMAKEGPTKRPTKSKRKKKSVLGDYDGIRAGSASILPPGARRNGKKRPHIYWIGFQPQSGGNARIFAQLGTEVPVQQRVEASTLVVFMEGARIGNRTVARYLDTRFFDTSIATMRTRQVRKRKAKGDIPGHGKGVELRFTFKNPVDAVEAAASVTTEQDGYSYVYLDFGQETESLSEE